METCYTTKYVLMMKWIYYHLDQSDSGNNKIITDIPYGT